MAKNWALAANRNRDRSGNGQGCRYPAELLAITVLLEFRIAIGDTPAILRSMLKHLYLVPKQVTSLRATYALLTEGTSR